MIKNRNIIFGDSNADSDDEDKYFRLPRIANASLPTASASNEGGIAYDTTNNVIVFSNGSSWSEAGA